MAKKALTVSVEESIEKVLVHLALPENENRNISNLTETLILEALKARGIDIKKYITANNLI